MVLRKLFLVGLICAFLAPTNVFAEKNKWSFTPYLGANVATSRDMVSKFDTSAGGAVTFSDGSQLAGTVTFGVDEVSFGDTHDAPILTGFDVGYSLSDTLEVFGGFEYVTAGGNKTKALTVTAAGNFTDSAGNVTALTLNETADIKMEDYNSWALKIGATKHFPMGNYTPYIGGYGGFKHVDDMKFVLSTNSTNVSTGKIKFYGSTNTGFFGAHTGVNRNLTIGGMDATLGIRARLDYTPELDRDDSDIDLVGAGSTNDGSDGVDFGLTAQVSIPF